MRHHRPALIPFLLLAAAAVTTIIALRRDLGEPHIRLFTEMTKTPAYQSQTLNPIFKNGKTLQRPPRGTISRDFHPFPYDNTPESRTLAGKELKNPLEPTFENLERGKAAYSTFCRHCHGSKGRGDGPAAEAFPGFSYSIAGKSTQDLPDGEIFHIATFGRSNMPSHSSQISQADRWRLVYYLRSLQMLEKARLGPLWSIPEDPRRHKLISEAYGRELFKTNCASCHGEEGRRPKPGIPTLHSPAVLAMADDAYYWDIINHGRTGSQMPAWKDILTRTQIRSLMMHIRSWSPKLPDRSKILVQVGNPKIGHALYRGHCAACHGKSGKGGIGNSLNNPSFLALASDKFLRDTIAIGRGHTAMPASYDFTSQDISDIIAHIRNWDPPIHTFADVEPLISSASVKFGKGIFVAKCGGCHGKEGKGGIGSRLNSSAFLRMIDDKFLYQGIVEGRPGTAMPSWLQLPARDIADLIKYIRTWQKSKSRMMSQAQATGRPEFGKVLFEKNCVKCHGPVGQGDIGAQIANPAFLERVTDAFLLQTIAYGKKGTEMKGLMKRKRDPLSQDDINHIITYLRFLQNRPSLDVMSKTYSWASVEDGRIIYEKTAACGKCHGMSGEGATGPALASPGFLRTASNGFIAGSVVMGRDATEMKSFYRGGNVNLSQEDVENVVAYVRSFEKKPFLASRRVDRTPTAAAEGKLLYGRFCAGCHGSEGRGGRDNERYDGYAPSLSSPEFLQAADDSFLLATIALGRPGTPMKSFSEGSGGIASLTAKEMRQIVAFIRTWEKQNGHE